MVIRCPFSTKVSTYIIYTTLQYQRQSNNINHDQGDAERQYIYWLVFVIPFWPSRKLHLYHFSKKHSHMTSFRDWKWITDNTLDIIQALSLPRDYVLQRREPKITDAYYRISLIGHLAHSTKTKAIPKSH